MHDSPYNSGENPDYVEHVMVPLSKGEGVACFVAEGSDGERSVLFASHALDGEADTMAHHVSSVVRAAHALAVQHLARVQAGHSGFRPIVG